MKINPCPICGREPVVYCGEALINGVFRDVDIACEDCGLYSGNCDTYKQAVTKWNEITKGKTND